MLVITAHVPVCQLGTIPQSPFIPWLCGAFLFETGSEKMGRYLLCLFHLWHAIEGRQTNSEVSRRLGYCLCTSDALWSVRRQAVPLNLTREPLYCCYRMALLL